MNLPLQEMDVMGDVEAPLVSVVLAIELVSTSLLQETSTRTLWCARKSVPSIANFMLARMKGQS